MGVAPRFAEPVAPVDAHDIAVGDVHAAEEAHGAVDDRYLAVVAVVDLACEARELHVQKRVCLDPRRPHALEKGFFHACAPYVVIQQTHLHALAGLGRERVAQAGARDVVAQDVVLDVDVVFCAGDRFEQRFHFRFSVDVGHDAAAAERLGVGGPLQQPHERQMMRRHSAGVGGLSLEPVVEPLAGAARDDASFGEVLPEKEVDDQPGAGREHQHEYPRQGLERVPVVGDDDQSHAEDRQGVDDQENGG